MNFISKYAEYGLTMESAESFVERGRTIIRAGKHIRFHKNQYATVDQKEIAFLRNHSDFGNDFYAVKSDPIDKTAIVRKQISADDQALNKKVE